MPPGNRSYDHLASEELHVLARAGDERAFTELFNRHAAALWRYLARLVGEADAEDVLQEALLKVLRGTFRADGAFTSWMFSIVHNQAIDWLRRVSPAVALNEAHDPIVEQAYLRRPDTDVVDDRDAVRRLLPLLSLEQRAAMLLVDGEGFSFREAADVLGTSHETVRRHCMRARAALLKALRPDAEEGTT